MSAEDDNASVRAIQSSKVISPTTKSGNPESLGAFMTVRLFFGPPGMGLPSAAA